MRLRQFRALHEPTRVAQDGREYVPEQSARCVTVDKVRAALGLRSEPLQRALVRASPVQPETKAILAGEVDQQHGVIARLVEFPYPERERHDRLRQAIAQAEDVMLYPNPHRIPRL